MKESGDKQRVGQKRFGGKLTWLGHAAFLIESPQKVRIAIDPWIENNPKFPKGFEYGKVDIVAATHSHFDHFADDGVELAKSSGATVVGIHELTVLASTGGVEKVSGMNKGGAQTLKGVEFRMVQAVHSADPCGYVMTFEDGYRIYHAGDTNVFLDMSLIGELYAPDLALLPIGDHYTMGPREAAKACELLKVPRVIPMHFGTFPILTGSPSALRDQLALRKIKTEVIELVPGASWPV